MAVSTLHERSLDSVDRTERIEAWQDMCSAALLGEQVWAAPGAYAPLSGSVRVRRLVDLLLVDYESSGFGARYLRTSHANDYVGFGVCAQGYGERLTLRDSRTVDLRDTACLWANSEVREYQQITGGRSVALFVPRAVLGGRSHEVDLIGSAYSASARVLVAMIEALRTQEGPIGERESLVLRTAMLELIESFMGAEAPPTNQAVSSAMRASVEAWTARQLPGGRPTATAAAQAHGISVRSLHRLFEDSEESFTAMLRKMRVTRTYRAVIECQEPLQSIASRYGFADASHFSREFRRQYGRSPREIRADCRVQPIGGSAGACDEQPPVDREGRTTRSSQGSSDRLGSPIQRGETHGRVRYR